MKKFLTLWLLAGVVVLAQDQDIRRGGGSGVTNTFDSNQFVAAGGTNVSLKSGVILTNPVLVGTLTASNASVGTLGQVLSSGGASFTPSWVTLAAGGGSSLDAITADAASSAIANGAFTNQWTWTNQVAATASFAVKFGLGNATSRGLDVREIEASTGGSGSQYLANFETAAASTATPFRIAWQGTELVQAGYNANQLWFSDPWGANIPQVSLASRKTTGLYMSSSFAKVQYDNNNNVVAANGAIYNYAGGVLITSLSSDGATDYSGAGGIVSNTGDSSNIGFTARSRVKTTAGGVTLTTGVTGATSLGSGSVQYITAAGTVVVPSSPVVGDTFTVIVGTSGAVVIDLANASHTLRVGASITSGGGTATATAMEGAVMKFTYVATNVWIAEFYSLTWVCA